MKYDDFVIGYRGSFTKKVTAEDNAKFADLSGDYNPIHDQPAYAARTKYKAPISNGFVTESRIAAALVSTFGSENTLVVAMQKKTQFLRPVYIGDDITAEVEVAHRIPQDRVLEIKARCINQRNEMVIRARFLIQIQEI